MAKCKLLAKDESDAALWDVLDAANQLRNTIPHSLSVEKIAEKMKQLKERYFAFLTEEQAAGLFGQPDDYIAMSACSTCAGFIATLEDRVRAGKPAVAAGAS
jgi:hypothetical protein